MSCKPFACWSCGACCYFMHKHPDYKDWKHPEKDHCKHLGKDNKCEIYEPRHEICRVDKQHSKNYSHVSWEEYCEINLDICKLLERMVYGKND